MTIRSLTPGEIAAARTCLTNHLDYGLVRIHDGPWFYFQPKHTAMAPDGHVYFHAADFLVDFSVNTSSMSWLVHELTHCWQVQTGQWVIMRGAFEREYGYGAITATTSFARLKIEQQASLVEDYYRLSNGMTARRGSGTIPDYRRVIPMVTPR